MKKTLPIFLTWIAFGLCILTLLAKLQIVFPSAVQYFQALAGIVFVVSSSWTWVMFSKISTRIMLSIEKWDQDIRQDIPQFIRTRRVRLISMLCLMVVMFCVQMFFGTHQRMSEIVSYVLIVCFFHCAMVTTLILFKLFRTLAWVEHENNLEKLEEA